MSIAIVICSVQTSTVRSCDGLDAAFPNIARFFRRESISRVSCALCGYELSFTLHRCAQHVLDNCSKASAERRWQAVNLLLETDDLRCTGPTTSRRVSSTATAAAAAAAALQAAAAAGLQAAAAGSSSSSSSSSSSEQQQDRAGSMGCHRCPDCRICCWMASQQAFQSAACPYNSIYQQHAVTFLKATH